MEKKGYKDDTVFDWDGNITIITNDLFNSDNTLSKDESCITFVGAKLCEENWSFIICSFFAKLLKRFGDNQNTYS